MVQKARTFLKYVLPAVMRPLRIVWNQIIGFFFFVLAVWAAPSAFRHIRDFDGDAESLFRVAMSGAFVLMMAFFAVTSFLRARRISKP